MTFATRTPAASLLMGSTGGRRQGDPLRGQRKITGIKSSDLKWNVALGGKEKEKLKAHLAHEKELGRSLYVE